MLTIENILAEMDRLGASDVIVTAGTPPQLRVLGSLQPMGDAPLTAADTERICLSMLTPEQATELRTNRSLDLSRSFPNLPRFRFNLFHQRDAMGLVARLIASRIPSFDELGLPPVIRDMALRPHGLILVTGPAGSGKSTTLAAMIDYVNERRGSHIVCIEDPIEFLHHHKRSVVEQREVGQDAHSFSGALRDVFRQSPDIIMIGEMRDLETMQLALTLAETGHLILATLHTQDTVHAINRMVDVFPPAQQQQVYTQLSMVLSAVITQALLVSSDGRRRLLAYEVMNVTPAIRNLIREMQLQQIHAVIQTGRADHMITMNDTLKQLVQDGHITSDVAMARSPRPKELARMLEHVPRQGGPRR
ncbi:MAG TPA: PilT/PilU family type 4a pilus ATPase [Kiritimatiellia bacterium]|nr:PilT/PilU family type 4a pilus ATPase [Kiritimatiellia bacterium]